MSRTSLVHPSTRDAPPEHQAKGIYQYTPPEVLAHLNGEQLDLASMTVVREFYESVGMSVPEAKPALAEPFYSNKGGGTVTDNVAGCQRSADDTGAPKRILRKPAPVFTDPLQALRTVADAAVSALPDDEAYNLLVKLAARFNFDIE